MLKVLNGRKLTMAIATLALILAVACFAVQPVNAEGPLKASQLFCEGGCNTPNGCVIYALLCGIYSIQINDGPVLINW